MERAAAGVRAQGSAELATAEDLWHVGSLTKSMTATLAGVLVERGDISWGTTVSEVLPGLIATTDPEYRDVRLDELLGHLRGRRRTCRPTGLASTTVRRRCSSSGDSMRRLRWRWTP